MSTTFCTPKRGPAHPPGATLDYTLDFTKALLSGETVATVGLAAEGVTASLNSNNGRKAVVMVTAAADAEVNTEATVTFTLTTSATPPRVYVQTLLLSIAPVYAVQIA